MAGNWQMVRNSRWAVLPSMASMSGLSLSHRPTYSGRPAVGCPAGSDTWSREGRSSTASLHCPSGVQNRARVEALLDAPARIEPAQPRSVDPRALWDRMEAHGYTQNEVARLAGISSGHLSQVMNGQRNPSGEVLAKLHGVLFRPTAAELVVPAEVKVMAWKKGGRNGVVVARRRRAGRWRQSARRRHRSHRRPGALGRRGGIHLHHRLRQPGLDRSPWSSGGAPECYGSRSRAEYTDTSAKPTIRPYWIGTCRARHWAGNRQTTRDRAR